MNTDKRSKLAAAVSLSALLAACGGGGGTSPSDSPVDTPDGNDGGSTTTTSTGTFQDSPVQGLSFKTSSGLTGTTNAAGEYQYEEGDVVTFSIAGSELGTTIASDVVTPLNLVQSFENADKGTNILRFLQSVDEDGNPDNGITLSENVLTIIESAPVNFNTDSATFEGDSSVAAALGEVGLGALISESDARAHFEGTLSGLSDNEVDLRGTWSTVWTNPVICPGDTAVATMTYTDTGVTFTGDELSTEMVDKGQRDIDGNVILEPDCYQDPISGTYSYAELPEDFCGPTCTLDELNRTITPWEGSSDKVVELQHTKGSDIMVRKKTRYYRDNENNRYLGSVSVATHYRQTDYALDMTGSWSYTQEAEGCPGGATSTVTFDQEGINITGEMITSRTNSSCIVEPVNLDYTYAEAPAQFCGPVCSYEELNVAATDSQGNTFAVFHAKDSGRFTVVKGAITATVVKK